MASPTHTNATDRETNVERPTLLDQLCEGVVSDSAIGSDFVDDDPSVPLSAASLSDDDDYDEDYDNEPLSDSRSPSHPSPTKSTSSSPEATTSGDDPLGSSNEAAATSVTLDDSPSKTRFRHPDTNDNDVKLPNSSFSSTLATSCVSCEINGVLSDSRDVDDGIQSVVRQRRPISHVSSSIQRVHVDGGFGVSTGVEDISPVVIATAGVASIAQDYLADSCDEDDSAPIAMGVDALSTDSNKKSQATEEEDSSRNASFNKWDPTSWPSWFERLFTTAGGSCENSFDDDVLIDDSCVVSSEVAQPIRTPSLSKNEFTCSCCFELMVEPTTIQCGHSFCRVCLANWYFGSNSKRTCPQCRQNWNGNPQTNVILRSAIRTLFPSELASRETETQEDVDSLKKLKRFDAAMARSQLGFVAALTRHLWPRTGNGFVNGCIFGFSVFLVVYLTFTWRHAEDNMATVTKQIVDWRVEDVASWLDSLGPWTKEYRDSFVDNAIDGQLVLALTDRDLQEPPFAIKLPYHRRAFLSALSATRTHGAKPPTNLWEYKAAKPGTSLLLLWGLKSLPRHTILLYMLLFNFDSILVPFIHITCPLVTDSIDNIPYAGDQRRLDPTFWELQPFRRKALFFQSLVSSKSGEDPKPTTTLRSPSFAQWVEFLMKTLLLPHFLVAEVAWDWLNVHYWTVRFILMDCLFLSAVELLRLRLLCQRNFSQFFTPYSAVIQEIGLLVVICFIWRFLPNLLCDIVFYSLLYVFPFLRMVNFAFRAANFLLNT